MELTASKIETPAWAAPRLLGRRVDPAAVSAWALGFALVTYLALRAGGYDTVVRSDVGIAIWWIVLVAALAGILPGRVGAAGWGPIGLLAAFATWTAIAGGWSENVEQTVIEVGRLAAYLGVLVLAIALQGRTAARHTINGLACAIGFVTVLAVLSRLHPQAFPTNQHIEFLGASNARRLSYPLDYWNGLAAFIAIGMPLLLAVAVGARTIPGQAIAAAVLPLGALCIYMTVSRGGVLELGAGLLVFMILMPRRLEALATLAVAGAAAAILIWAESRRAAVVSGLPTPAALHQGTRLLWLVLIVCTGVALLQVAIALAARHLDGPALLSPNPRATGARAAAAVAVAIVVAVAAGVPSTLERDWHNFKQPTGVIVPHRSTTVFDRLSAVNGNGRYQYWQAAVKAFDTNPLGGIGPGTFQFWWARHATTSGFVRNAHSLYFETLAETGLIGLALLGAMLLWFVVVAVRRNLRSSSELRLWLAAATAGLWAFLVAAAVDWVWQLFAIAATALVLGAVIVCGREGPPAPRERKARGWVGRAVLATLALVAIAAISVPLAEQLAIRQSQSAAAAGNLRAALADSVSAERIEPYAATPHLQEALLFEAAGQLRAAAVQARIATRDAPTDWTTWLTLARIDARLGDRRAALAELRRARSLNPRSNLFAQV
jgi:O-antigen ligase